MKKHLSISVLLSVPLLLGHFAYTSNIAFSASRPSPKTVIIDHTFTDPCVLSEAEIKKAAAVRIYFEHASVGGNIVNGLKELKNNDPRLDFGSFTDRGRGNPGARAKIDWFYESLTDRGGSHYRDPGDFDAVMMKFCYIDNRYSGFSSAAEAFRYYRDRMNALQKQFPRTTIVWWTMPLQTSGDARKDEYNTLVRNYCKSTGKVLFDIADIESHDPDGSPCRDRNGEKMYPAYSHDGGHLNREGSIRAAGAYWMLAYRISLK